MTNEEIYYGQKMFIEYAEAYIYEYFDIAAEQCDVDIAFCNTTSAVLTLYIKNAREIFGKKYPYSKTLLTLVIQPATTVSFDSVVYRATVIDNNRGKATVLTYDYPESVSPYLGLCNVLQDLLRPFQCKECNDSNADIFDVISGKAVD